MSIFSPDFNEEQNQQLAIHKPASKATVTLTFGLGDSRNYNKSMAVDDYTKLCELANEVMTVLEVNMDHSNSMATFIGTTQTSIAIVSSKVYGNSYAASRIKRLQYMLEV